MNICQCCGAEIETYTVHGNGGTTQWCLDCIDNSDTWHCCECGEDFAGEVAQYHFYDSDDNYCEECYNSEDSFCCDNCCNEFVHSECHYVDDGCLCDDCYDEYNNHQGLLSYGEEHNTNWQTQKIEGETDDETLYGTEVEVETDGIKYEDLDYIRDNLPVVLSEDGSLSSDGFEIVTHPMTWGYIQKNYDKFKEVYETLIQRNFRSHDTNTCGFHIHVTRPSDEVIDRILFIMETYKDELIQFSRRRVEKLREWASFLSDYVEHGEKVCSLDFIKKSKGTSNRYMALNLCNSKTIEFRLFRGTLNVDTYYASLELVHNLVNACSDLKKPLSEITWEYITRTKYARSYVERRGIYSNKTPKDMSNEMLRQYQKEQRERNKGIKLLFEIMRELSHLQVKVENINLQMQNDEICSKARNIREQVQSLKYYSIETIVSNILELTRANESVEKIKMILSSRAMENKAYISPKLNEKIREYLKEGKEV